MQLTRKSCQMTRRLTEKRGKGLQSRTLNVETSQYKINERFPFVSSCARVHAMCVPKGVRRRAAEPADGGLLGERELPR